MQTQVVFQSAVGTERSVSVTERSSEEATMNAAVRVLERMIGAERVSAEGWMPLRVA